MIELEFNNALFPQLEIPLEKQHLGGADFSRNNAFAKIRAFIGDQPTAFAFEDVEATLGRTYPSVLKLYRQQFSVWMIKNNFFVKKDGGLAEPVRVGIEIEYRNDELKLNKGKTCVVVSMLPSPMFREIGKLKGHLNGEIAPSGEIKLGPDAFADALSLNDQLPLSGNLKVGVSAGLEAGMNFAFTVNVPLISAVGIGSSRAEWEFHEESTNLYDQDIETWTFLALPKRSSESGRQLRYRIRLYLVLRTAFISTRHTTEWKDLNCTLTAPSRSTIPTAD